MDVRHVFGSPRGSKMAKGCVLAGSALIASSVFSIQTAGAAPPTGFVDETVATVGAPTALAATPDNRMLVTTQPGVMRIIDNNQLITAPALDIKSRVCSEGERGMLGVAVDPQFTTNKYIYVYYTSKKTDGGCANRVSRFTMNGDVADVASENVLLDGLQTVATNHNGGDVQIGKDGYLYISVGDSAQSAWARDLSRLNGKILRITTTGGIPADNPYMDADSARCTGTGATDAGKKCQEVFASGLRNPFRMAFDSNSTTTKFYINDVGQNSYEEIDLGTKGADYGWNVREGLCSGSNANDCGAAPAGLTNPIYAYGRDTGCGAITGGAFVPAQAYGAAFAGTYLFSDFTCGKIFSLKGGAATAFATGLGSASAVDMTFAPYGTQQALYYTNYTNGGQVHRIRLNVMSPSSTTSSTSSSTSSIPSSTTSTSTTSTSTTAKGPIANIPVITLVPKAATTTSTTRPAGSTTTTSSTTGPTSTTTTTAKPPFTTIPVVTVGPSTTTSTTSTTVSVVEQETTTTRPPVGDVTHDQNPDEDFVETPIIDTQGKNNGGGQLAFTGINVMWQLGAGVLLVSVGGLLTVVRRKIAKP